MSLNRPLTPEEQAKIDQDYLSIQAQQNSNDAHPMNPKKGLGVDPSATNIPAQTPGIGIGDVNVNPTFNGFDAVEKMDDELVSFGTDAAGKSIGGVSGGAAAGAAVEAIQTGDPKAAAMNLALSTAGTAAGTAVAGPIGGMIGGALASSLAPKKKKKLEHLV